MRDKRLDNGAEIKYPDELSFVFNRNTIYIRVPSDDIITTIIRQGATSYEDTRETYKGEVQIDISEYIKMFFHPSENNLLTDKEINVVVDFDSGGSFEFDTYFIWGALNIGDVFNKSRNVTWFKNYPQTVSIYDSDGTIQVQYDSSELIDLEAERGVIHIDMSKEFKDVKDHVYILLKDSLTAVFDYTFDYTFTPIRERQAVMVRVNDCDNGVFIRWIDSHGFYQYWLFNSGDESYKTSDVGEELDAVSLPESLSVFYGIKRVQGKNTDKTMKLCAPLVDKETFDMLLTLLSSPLPSLWNGNDWVPISIVSGTSTKTNADLQDFEIQIQTPPIITQQL